MVAGCTRNETVKTASQEAVSFGGYAGRTQTKAGVTEDITLDVLKSYGFGVFATYSGTSDFSAATNDFMNNEDVAYNGTAWTYSPIRYWPNPTDGKDATDQKVSFFAYAPFTDPAASGADNSYGITGFAIEGSHNVVNYTFHNTKPNVDLLWGYKTGTTDPRVPNLNLTRTDGTVSFTFRHTLSKLGGSQEGIQNPDDAAYKANGLIIKASPTEDPTDAYIEGTQGDFGTSTGTKITISKIVVESAPEEDPVGTPVVDANGNNVVYATAPQTGKLDLYSGIFTLDAAAQPVKFKQVVSADASDIAAGASELADYLKEVPGVTDFSQIKTGVIKQPRNVYADESNPIILLPGTAPVVDVTITYTVRTYDAKLPARSATVANSTYTEVPQTVFGRVLFPTIEENKKYNLCIILGLNDVKFSATVEDWTPGNWTDTNGNGVIDDGELTGTEKELWLPANL